MPPRAFLAVVLLSGHAGAGRLICSRATSGVEHGIADAATMAFMNDTDLADVNKPALVFDVGANNGDYSCKLLKTLRSRVHSRRVHLHMIEPQPQFRIRYIAVQKFSKILKKKLSISVHFHSTAR